MKILFFGMSSNAGGIEVVEKKVFDNADKFNTDFIICGEKMAFEEHFIEKGSNVYHLPRRRKIFSYYFSYFKFFKKHAKEYDAIHCSYCNLYSITPLFFAWLFRIKIRILHSRSSNYDTKKIRLKVKHLINKKFASFFANRFISCSHIAAKFLFTKRRYRKKKYEILNNPLLIDNNKFSIEKREKIREEFSLENKEVILHVGVFLDVKNHYFICDVFSKLLEKNKELILILVGSGQLLEPIKNYVKRIGVDNKVIFTGSIDNVDEFYCAADLFVLPSKFEGLANVALEAQCCNLRCFLSNTITKDISVNSELVDFLDINNENQWVERINAYLDSDRYDRTASIDGKFDNFALSNIIDKYYDLYK